MISMKNHILWPFLFGVIIIVSINSCTKTITQIKTVDSTVTVRDTVRDTAGDAEVRFICMFPDNVTTNIPIHKTDASLLVAAQNFCPSVYSPVWPDSSMIFLASIIVPSLNLDWYDTMFLPPLGHTMNTYALFFDIDNTPDKSDTSLRYTYSVDSEKLTPAPANECYVRFIHGIQDADQFYVELDTADNTTAVHSIFYSSGPPRLPLPIQWGIISDYVLIPSGPHTLYFQPASNLSTGQVSFTIPQSFEAGGYYTVLATGRMSDGSDQIVVDQE